MIVMKFGGTSLADAERIAAVGEIVRAHLDRKPVVVLSAMARATNLLESAVQAARRDDLESVDAAIGELAKRHRWAIAGTLGESPRRHDLDLEVDATLEELRQLLRSVRILGEGTPRAADTLLAFGERLSTRIASEAFSERGIPSEWIDPREVMITDGRHGAAAPDAAATAERCRERLAPVIDGGRVPVVGGFVGASGSGETTTLGRGGGDTSAAVLGSALGAEEIQIWTDVDGLMTADPRAVPAARRLPSVSFAEAADLAHYGAKVLHPASIAPAVQRRIPVRVLNSLAPESPGTVILDRPEADAPALASVTSRRGVSAVRVATADMRSDPGLVARLLRAVRGHDVDPGLTVASEVAATVVVADPPEREALERALGAGVVVESIPGLAIVCVVVESIPGLAIVCVVGAGLARDGAERGAVLEALAAHRPVVVGLGARSTSVTAAVDEQLLDSVVRDLHRRFFEGPLREAAVGRTT